MHAHICAHSSLIVKGKNSIRTCIEGARTHFLVIIYCCCFICPGPSFCIFQIKRESERITTLTTFLLQRRLLLFDNFCRLTNEHRHTHTLSCIRPFITKHLLLARSLASYCCVWNFMSIWSCKHFFSKCIERILNPEVFSLLALSLVSLFAYFAFLCHLRTQVHSKPIISLLWRYMFINGFTALVFFRSQID